MSIYCENSCLVQGALLRALGQPRWEKVLITQPCLSLCDPMDCSPPGSSVHGILQARILEWELHFLLQGIFVTQRLNPDSPALQADSLPFEPPGKPSLNGKEVQKRGDIGIHTADSLCHKAETNTTL